MSEVALRVHFSCCVFLSIDLQVQCPAREPPNLLDLSRGKQLSKHRGDCTASCAHRSAKCTCLMMTQLLTSLSSCRLLSQSLCVCQKTLACRSAYCSVYCVQKANWVFKKKLPSNVREQILVYLKTLFAHSRSLKRSEEYV